MDRNSLRQVREAKMLSKTELAGRAGMPCRIKSQRQIVLALGLKVSTEAKSFSR